MSLARAISRGAFLKARLGVNGTKNASRSFGTVGASGRVASDISSLLRAEFSESGCRYISQSGRAECRRANQHQCLPHRAFIRQRLFNSLALENSTAISMGNGQPGRADPRYKSKIVQSTFL